ncbi:MAG: hypothetical protein HY544_04515 [Candidatus Diapherotrites archaeon]|uniref:Uncharacterized protein n=1 Tax=Candidatus Iainarchaeum sp. TaxID=3101447 RepID=A0A8T3YM07_9ARCH|nr:hypothetical protein [Candidatus Diapherotrites archaeon]
MAGHRHQGFSWDVSYLLIDKAREKVRTVLSDKHLAALLAAEFFLTLAIIGAIYVFLDARISTLQEPFNFIIFGIALYAIIHIYTYTQSYRASRTNSIMRRKNLRTFLLELAIFSIVVISAYIYQNPALNVAPYPFNILIFLLVLSWPLYFYVQEKFVMA